MVQIFRERFCLIFRLFTHMSVRLKDTGMIRNCRFNATYQFSFIRGIFHLKNSFILLFFIQIQFFLGMSYKPAIKIKPSLACRQHLIWDFLECLQVDTAVLV